MGADTLFAEMQIADIKLKRKKAETKEPRDVLGRARGLFHLRWYARTKAGRFRRGSGAPDPAPALA